MSDDSLGPFQKIWEAWSEAYDELAQKLISHFRRAAEIQFDELEEHLEAGDRVAAALEAMDSSASPSICCADSAARATRSAVQCELGLLRSLDRTWDTWLSYRPSGRSVAG